MKLVAIRSGSSTDDTPRAVYTVSVPRLETLAEDPFGDSPVRSGTGFSAIDARTIIEPSRWERLYLQWLAHQSGAELLGPSDTLAQNPISESLASTEAWRIDDIPAGVRLRRAATRRGEARAVVRDIRAALVNRDLSGASAAEFCHQVTILVPNRPEVFALWYRELTYAGLPIRTQHFEPLAMHSIARWVVGLAQLSRWESEPVAREHLRGLLEASHWSQKGIAHALHLDSTVHIRREMRTLLSTIRRDSFRLDEWLSHISATATVEAKDTLLSFSKAVADATASGPNFLQRLRTLLLDFDARNAVRATGNSAAIEVMEKVLRVLANLVHEETRCGGVHPDARMGLAALIDQGFRTQWVRVSESYRHGVLLMAYDAYDGSTSEMLFATGLGEGDFPSIPRQFNSVEEAWARELRLIHPGESVQDYINDDIERQIRLASRAFDECSAEVVLSYSTEGPGTEERYPGPLLSLLVGGWSETDWFAKHPQVEVFTWADEIPKNPQEADNWGDVALFAEDARFRSWLRKADDEESLTGEDSEILHKIIQRAGDLKTSRAAFRERTPRAYEAPIFGGYSGMLPGAAEPPSAYSASALEAYGQCGTKYFFSRVLRISDESDLQENLEHREAGTIIHDAFAEAAQEAISIADGVLWSMCIDEGESKEDALERIRESLEGHLDRVVRQFMAAQASMSEALLRAVVQRWSGAIRKWLESHLVHRLPGTPTAYELGNHPKVRDARAKVSDYEEAIQAVSALERATESGECKSQSAAGDFLPELNKRVISKKELVETFRDKSFAEKLSELGAARDLATRELKSTEEEARHEWGRHFNQDVAHAELAFGMSRYDSDSSSTDEPVTIWVDDRRIQVRGQVDRVDWDRDRHQIAVRDYKTGKRRSTQSLGQEIELGQHIQLPLYAMAIEELAKAGTLPHLNLAEAVEVSLEFPRDPSSRDRTVIRLDQPSGFALGGDTVTWKHMARIWLHSHVSNIEGGSFPLFPSSCPIEGRGYCDYERTCGYTMELGARASDPRARRPVFEKLQEDLAVPKEKIPCIDVISPTCSEDSPDAQSVRAEHDRASLAAADIGNDVVIAAGAGTGKTYNLVLRYLAALASGATPDQILSITFTRRAAAEMKKRIREALLSKPSGPQEPYVHAIQADRPRFRRILLQLSSAPITTIDSFAGEIFRESQAWKAHRDHVAARAFDVVTDDDVSEQLRTYVRRRFITSLEEDDPHLRHLTQELDPVAVRDLLLEASQRDISAELGKLQSLEERKRYLSDAWYRIMSSTADWLWAAMKEWPLDDFQDWLSQASASSKKSEQPSEEGASWLRHFVSTLRSTHELTEVERWKFIHTAFKRSAAQSEFGDKRIGSVLRDLRAETRSTLEANDPERFNAFKDWLKALEKLEEFATTAAHATFVAQSWAEGFREFLVEAGRVRFSDVEVLATHALHDPAIVDAIGSRFAYRHIFLDEAQDTSDSQIQLIEAARRMAQEQTGAACHEFVVGDVKQSIYGFRGAEVDVFMRRVEQGANTFTVNRRSTPSLIQAFNRLFDALLEAQDDLNDLDPRASISYEPLVWPEEKQDDAGASVELFYDTDESWIGGIADNLEDLPEEEALASEEDEEIFKASNLQRGLAKRIGELVKLYPPGDNGASIAILVGSWRRADFYRELLDAYQIPAAVQGGRGLLKTPEVDGLVQWIEAAAHPNRRTSLLAAIRGPGIAISDAGLYVMRVGHGMRGPQQDGPHTLRAAALMGSIDPQAAVIAWRDADPELDTDVAFSLLNSDAESLVRFQRVWNQLTTRLGVEAPSATLSWLSDELGLWSFWHGRPSGRQAVANLRSFIDMVRDLESNFGQDPWLILRRLTEMRDNSDPAAGGLDASGGAPVIITTYWQAKGLEWPVVVLPDIEKTKYRSSPHGLGDNRICIVDADYDVIHTPEIRVSSTENPLRSKVTEITTALDQYRLPAKRAELRRLLYVAMTRARNKLLISGTYSVPNRPPDEARPTRLNEAKDWATTLRVTLGLTRDDDGTLSMAETSPWSGLSTEGRIELVDGALYGADLQQRIVAHTNLHVPTDNRLLRRWQVVPGTRVNLTRPSDLVVDEVPAHDATLSTILPNHQAFRDNPFETDADLGTAFHLLMERCAFLNQNLEELALQVLQELRFDLPHHTLPARLDMVLQMARLALSASIASELRAAAERGELYHELPLTFLRNEKERVFGVVDLVWRDDRGDVHLLDYKTGFKHPTTTNPMPNELRHHFAQTKVYADGLMLCDFNVVTFGIWYVAAPALLRWRVNSPHLNQLDET